MIGTDEDVTRYDLTMSLFFNSTVVSTRLGFSLRTQGARAPIVAYSCLSSIKNLTSYVYSTERSPPPDGRTRSRSFISNSPTSKTVPRPMRDGNQGPNTFMSFSIMKQINSLMGGGTSARWLIVRITSTYHAWKLPTARRRHRLYLGGSLILLR